MNLLATIAVQLEKSFSLNELQTLCFDLGVEYENIPGNPKGLKGCEIVAYFEHTGRIANLLAYCQQERPYLNWLLPTPKQEQSMNRLVQQRLSELQSQYDLLSEKIGRYRRQLAIEAGIAARFQLEKELEQAEADRVKLAQEMDKLPPPPLPSERRDRCYRPEAPPPPPSKLSLIRQAAEQRRLVLWVGGDAPAGLSGLPSRQELADKLAGQNDLPAGRTLAWVTQQLMEGGNRWHFTDFLLAEMSRPQPPQPFQQQIVQWVNQAAIKTIIVTAYDNLLKRAFELAGVAGHWVVDDNGLPFIRPERPTLLKLYGDLEFIDSLVVTEQDHNALLRGQSRPGILQQTAQAIRGNTVLFIGHDPTDPTATALLDGWLNGPFAIPAYAIWSSLSGREIASFATNRHLTILEAEPLACLKWLSQP